jgi:hypothetical protein
MPTVEKMEYTAFNTLSAIFYHRTSKHPVFDQRRFKQLHTQGAMGCLAIFVCDLHFFAILPLLYFDRVTEFVGCRQTGVTLVVKSPSHDVVKAFV